MPINLSNKKYSISQTAKLLNLHPKTLRRWENKGKFASKRTLGNQRRYSQQDINQLQKIKQGQSPTPIKQTSLLSLNQTAAKLGVSPVTVQRWTKQGKFPPAITKTGIPYYSLDQIKSSSPGRNLFTPRSSSPGRNLFAPRGGTPSTPRGGINTTKISFGSIALSICIITFLFIQSRQNQITSPTVEQLGDLQDINMALSKVGTLLLLSSKSAVNMLINQPAI